MLLLFFNFIQNYVSALADPFSWTVGCACGVALPYCGGEGSFFWADMVQSTLMIPLYFSVLDFGRSGGFVSVKEGENGNKIVCAF